MDGPQTAPYGSWRSPITSDLIVGGTIRLGQVALDGEDTYWLESRPSDGGRNVIVRRTPDGKTEDVTPPTFNVRSRVHEYGGGAYSVSRGTVYFSNDADQRLYGQEVGGKPEPITPQSENEGLRYADAVIDHPRGRLVCVREDHTGGDEAVNTIVTLTLDGEDDEGQVLISGNDFYATPRLSPDGSKLAWLTWHHPNMPWDGTELWVADVAADGSLGEKQQVAGGADESIFQPEWSPEGVLHFVSDRTGWWNLYRWRDGKTEPLCEMEAEFGQPQWVFGYSAYSFASAERIICSYGQQGMWRLASLNTHTGKLSDIATPYTEIFYVRASPERAVFVGGAAKEPSSVAQVDLGTLGVSVLQRSSNVDIDLGYLSTPQAITFPTESGLTAHGFFYPPSNRDYMAPIADKPPLLVESHGGPTSSSSTTFDLGIQYWTSRGIAVLDVNYGGSTGYGREYRQRLNGQWGVVDVDDCVNGAKYLVEQGLVDGDKLIIHGWSAGGYTTLNALTFRDVFKAGASYYGISDLEAMALDTHKFESRYLDSMVGPYPAKKKLYRERSAIHHTEGLNVPVIFFQGLEDKVVPPNQAEMMVDVLRKKGVPVAYIPFEGEQHGFRRAENIKRSLDAELYFYSRVFGFELADPVEPVEIENL